MTIKKESKEKGKAGEPPHRLRVAVLIPAAGSASRMGGNSNKVLRPLAGRGMIVRTVEVFQASPLVERIGVILREEEIPRASSLFREPAADRKLLPWIVGGATRQESVWEGMEVLAEDPPDYVLVHDGARPHCSSALIDRMISALGLEPAVVPVLPMTDTLRQFEEGGSRVLDRSGIHLTQTPQGFHWSVLLHAHQTARKNGLRGTDDAQLVEAVGISVTPIEGDVDNIKVTTESDFAYAQWLFGKNAGVDGDG